MNNGNKLTDTENKLKVAKWEGAQGNGGRGGVKGFRGVNWQL